MIRKFTCRCCGHLYPTKGLKTSFMIKDLFVHFPLCLGCLYCSSLWQKIVIIFRLSKAYKKRRLFILFFGRVLFSQRKGKRFDSRWTEEEREIMGRKDSWSGVTIKNGKVVR